MRSACWTTGRSARGRGEGLSSDSPTRRANPVAGDGAEKGMNPVEHARIKEMKAEIRRLVLENVFPNCAAAFFSKEHL